MRFGRRAVVGAGVLIVVVAVGVVVVSSFARPATRSEVGVVVSVEALSLTDVRSFTIRTPDGRTVRFAVGRLENGAQFPPGHLGEHMATALPILVTYRDEGGEHVAVRLEDAPGASPS